MGKFGLGDSIKVQKEVPISRLPALPSEPQGDAVHRQYGGRVVFAVFVTRNDGSHDDVQWYAGIPKAECAFEDEPTLKGQVRRLFMEKGDFVPRCCNRRPFLAP